MELPDVVKEKLLELDEENNRLKVEVQRLQARLASKDEILNDLEEENVQLRNSRSKRSPENCRNTAMEQTIAELNEKLDEKRSECLRLTEQLRGTRASLDTANVEIRELRSARAALEDEDEQCVAAPPNNEDLDRLQEEKDDAIFELQRATHRMAALETERDDYAERAEAACAEAREMARHLKELREQLHVLEAELAASRSNVGVANRGNSMFAEFAEERVRLENDLKTLFSKYEAVRKENYQLSNELDEARLLALRRGRSEGTQRCRCQQISGELVDLRGRVRTLDDRLAKARNDLIDMARTTRGIDPVLKSYYRSLKMEMEMLRQERAKLRDERDKFLDENASLTARVVNAEKMVEYANDDVEALKLQLSMLREREQRKDAEKVSNLIAGEGGDDVPCILPSLFTSKTTPLPVRKHPFEQAKEATCGPRSLPGSALRTSTPHVDGDKNSSFDRLSATAAKPKFEPRLKRLRFADTEQKVDISRRDSISASELRRLARKQARKGVSKVLPIAEPLLRITAKLTTDTADDELPLTSRVGGNDTKDAISCQSTCSYVAKETNAKKMRFDRSSYVEGDPATTHLSKCSSTMSDRSNEAAKHAPLTRIQDEDSFFEGENGSFRLAMLDSTTDFSRTMLDDVPEEKENDSSCKSSQNQ